MTTLADLHEVLDVHCDNAEAVDPSVDDVLSRAHRLQQVRLVVILVVAIVVATTLLALLQVALP
jgi:hypothetical protein